MLDAVGWQYALLHHTLDTRGLHKSIDWTGVNTTNSPEKVCNSHKDNALLLQMTISYSSSVFLAERSQGKHATNV